MYKLWVAENESTAQESINTLKHLYLEEQINNQPYFNRPKFFFDRQPQLLCFKDYPGVKTLNNLLFDHFKIPEMCVFKSNGTKSTVPNIKIDLMEYAKGHRSESHNTKPSGFGKLYKKIDSSFFRNKAPINQGLLFPNSKIAG